MTEYALVGPEGEIKATASDIDPRVKTRQGWRWLPVEVSDSAWDEATEMREGPNLTVTAGTVTRSWTTRPKTEAEREAEKDALVDAALPPVLLGLIAELGNRIGKLDGGEAQSAADVRAAARAML